jgi:hypothetical protein
MEADNLEAALSVLDEYMENDFGNENQNIADIDEYHEGKLFIKYR